MDPGSKIKRSQLRLAPLFQRLLIILSYHFLTLDLFLSDTPKGWKESIGLSDAELYTKYFEKKKHSLKKSNILEACQTLEILGVAISSLIISFRLLSISRHFNITQKNYSQLIQSRKISCIFFLDYLKRKDSEQIEKKSLYS